MPSFFTHHVFIHHFAFKKRKQAKCHLWPVTQCLCALVIFFNYCNSWVLVLLCYIFSPMVLVSVIRLSRVPRLVTLVLVFPLSSRSAMSLCLSVKSTSLLYLFYFGGPSSHVNVSSFASFVSFWLVNPSCVSLPFPTLITLVCI